jgi:hypothetical protein
MMSPSLVYTFIHVLGLSDLNLKQMVIHWLLMGYKGQWLRVRDQRGLNNTSSEYSVFMVPTSSFMLIQDGHQGSHLDLVSIDSLMNAQVDWSDIFVGYLG